MNAPEIEGHTFVEYLGPGGYSDVYLYERSTPRMRVAVKVLKDARLSAAEQAQFAAEAEIMAELADHPNIVQVFSTGRTADGRPFLVMKYYPPPNLGVRAGRERFTVAEVLRTGVKIASAVETAHRAGILHRDIKPANILVSQYGEPGLTDFGIAGHGAEDEGDELGVSIPWSPPEVLSGSSNGTPQSDVYSLAATIWHLLVGRSPFEVPAGDNGQAALMSRVLRTPAPATGRADVPASLDRLLQQGMAKNPAVRPRTALDFARAIQSIEQEQRFARTDIVVEGLTGTTGERAAAASRSAVPEDRTRLRAPTRVTPSPVPPSSASSSTASPSRFAPTSPSGAPAATRSAEPPTTARPAVATSAPDSGLPRRRAAGPQAQTEKTTLRPTAPSGPAADEPPTERRGIKKAYAITAAAMVVAAAVVIAVIVSAGKPKHKHDATLPTPRATDQVSLPPAGVEIAASYDAATKTVHFTWTIQPASDSANYVWRLVGDTTEHRTATAAADVPSTNPSATCIEVSVVEGGASSSYSQPKCGG